MDRSSLWTSETPQVFNQEILQEAYDKKLDIIDEFSDEASLIEECGFEVKICENKNLNNKNYYGRRYRFSFKKYDR